MLFRSLLVSLARQEHPDTSQFADPEVVWKMEKSHHVGLIVRSPDPARVRALLEDYTARIARDYHAVEPPQQQPSH